MILTDTSETTANALIEAVREHFPGAVQIEARYRDKAALIPYPHWYVYWRDGETGLPRIDTDPSFNTLLVRLRSGKLPDTHKDKSTDYNLRFKSTWDLIINAVCTGYPDAVREDIKISPSSGPIPTRITWHRYDGELITVSTPVITEELIEQLRAGTAVPDYLTGTDDEPMVVNWLGQDFPAAQAKSFDGLTAPAPKYRSILAEADSVTLNDREKQYSHPLINFARVAPFWEVYMRQVGVIPAPGELPKPLTAEHVSQMMVLFKLVREINSHKRDNVVDEAGYVSCVERIHEAMIALGYAGGIEDLRRMSHDDIRAFNERLEATGTNAAIYNNL